MTTNAILFPGQESQTCGKRDDFECVPLAQQRAAADPVGRAAAVLDRSDV